MGKFDVLASATQKHNLSQACVGGLGGEVWPQGAGGRDPEPSELGTAAPGMGGVAQLLASIALRAETSTLLGGTRPPPGQVLPGCPTSCL